jgi:hypothetical protein
LPLAFHLTGGEASDRIWQNERDKNLKAGRTESTFPVNGRPLSEGEMRRIVAYARPYGFLKQAERKPRVNDALRRIFDHCRAPSPIPRQSTPFGWINSKA